MARFIKQLLPYDPSSNELRLLLKMHHIIGFNLRNRAVVTVSRFSMLLSVIHALCFVYRVHIVMFAKKLSFEYQIAALNVVGGYIFGAIRMIGFAWYYEDFRRIYQFMEQRTFQTKDKQAQLIREQHYENNRNFTIVMLLVGFGMINFFNLTDFRTTDQYDIPFELNFMNPTLKSIINIFYGLYLHVLGTYFWIPFITLRVVIYTFCAEMKVANNAFADLFKTASEHTDILMGHHQSSSSSENAQPMEQAKEDMYWICVRNELRRLVDHHKELLINVDRICRLAAVPFLSETMACISISSISIFFLLKGESLIMVGIAMVLLCESFYGSSLVEELQEVHEDMGAVIYALEWPSKLRYDRRNHGNYKHVTKILQIVLMRSQSRLRFHCGGLFEMSRATFTFTVKTCYTLLTFLLQMQAA